MTEVTDTRTQTLDEIAGHLGLVLPPLVAEKLLRYLDLQIGRAHV